MASRDLQKKRRIWRDWYNKNKTEQLAKIYASRAIRQKRAQDWLIAYKKAHPCTRCGFNNPAALEFHHKDRKTKEFWLGKRATYVIERLQTEIAKCEILCANCHKIEHAPKYYFS